MHPSTAQALVVVDELLRGGVTDVVLAPGSRSAPLALALAQAEADGRVRLHVRLDERVAGYLAIGLSRGSGLPVAVVTTSGTAAVNLHPAVVEASRSGVALLVLTADRPPALRATGANQTIDQPGLFGGEARWAQDLDTARREPGQVRYWRSVVSRAVAAAADPADPGPVHLNVPFADPLVPDASGSSDWPEPLDGRPQGRPWTVDGRLSAAMALPLDTALADLLGTAEADPADADPTDADPAAADPTQADPAAGSDPGAVPARGLVVMGDHDDPEAADLVDDLASALGWPVVAEPTSGGADAETAIRHGPLLLASPHFAAAHRPDLVLTVGRVGLTRAVLRAVAGAGLHVAVDPHPPARLADPTRTASLVLAAVPLPPERLPAADPTWLDSWQRADREAAQVVDRMLADTGPADPGPADGGPVDAERADAGPADPGPANGAVLSGPVVARCAARSVPADGLLVVGASWPVRHLEAFAADSLPAVAANRGTAGIDGTVSMAWGAALATGAPTVALMGDLAFRYDAGGMLVPPAEPRPDLVVVVVDNDGGGIFSALEQGAPEHAEHFDRVFGTPFGLDLAPLAASMGLPVVTVTDLDGLRAAVAQALAAGGVRVVVARTIARDAEADLLRRIQTAVDATLGRAAR